MKKFSRIDGGFSLVEVALAMGIASFCLVTLMALLPVGIQSYQQADNQSAMVNLATMVVRDLQATPTGTGTQTSPRFGFQVPAAGGGATSSASPITIYVDASGIASGMAPGSAPNASSIYRISVFFTPPGAGLRMATTARIWITFPANADPSPGTAPTNYTTMFETTISLNRN